MNHAAGLCCCAAVLALAPLCDAQTVLTTKRVASGLTMPLFVTWAPGDPGRLFIVEQYEGTTGVVKILDMATGAVRGTPFLEVPGLVTEGEQGLLGLAFHPDYQNNGYLYVNYTTVGDGPGGRTVVARYTVSGDANIVDALSARTVITVEQPESNHNGGWMGFGPDGYLYVALGDGGGGNDPDNHAQTLVNDLLGKMLRLDVDGDDFPGDDLRNYRIPASNPFVGSAAAPEIWAYGLRNPWRNSFDRTTGDFWIADVGQALREELDFQPARDAGGENYGWHCMEGTVCTGLSGCSCDTPLGVAPIYDYAHDQGCSIIGGYVYRGAGIPDLRGTYFFGDLCSAQIWSMRYDGERVLEFTNRTAELAPGNGMDISFISSFGEDFYGELYVVDYSHGEVFKIVGQGVCAADFNHDGFVDGIDYDLFVAVFETGATADFNGDGFVDGIDSDNFNLAFEPGDASADINHDGFVDGIDSDLFNRLFEAGIMTADVSRDGFVDGIDYDLFMGEFESGC